MKRFIWITFYCFWLGISHAWTNHSILNYYVLQGKPGLTFNPDEYVQVESLDSFIRANESALVSLLNTNEIWAKQNVPGYHPLPLNIAFDPQRKDCQTNLELCFKHAIRINPNLPLTPIIFDPYNQATNPRLKTLDFSGYQDLMLPEIRLKTLDTISKEQLSNSPNYKRWYLLYANVFKQVPIGEKVRWAMVYAAASSVPDFGLDIFLYDDDGQDFDKLYGFGNQPVGVPGIVLSSQILFHMSTYYLSGVLKMLQPGLRSCYLDYRFHLYAMLAKLAHKGGHGYWAGVFAGYANHYLEDLTQPYHANFIEGYSAGYVLYIHLLSFFRPTAELLLKNHLAIQHQLTDDIPSLLIMKNAVDSLTLEKSLSNYYQDSSLPECNLNTPYLKDVVNINTLKISDNFAKVIKDSFPHDIVLAEHPINGETLDEIAIYNQLTPAQKNNYLQAINERFGAFGGYTRKCLNTMMAAEK